MFQLIRFSWTLWQGLQTKHPLSEKLQLEKVYNWLVYKVININEEILVICLLHCVYSLCEFLIVVSEWQTLPAFGAILRISKIIIKLINVPRFTRHVLKTHWKRINSQWKWNIQSPLLPWWSWWDSFAFYSTSLTFGPWPRDFSI